MERDPRAFVWDVQQACARIIRFVHGKDLAAYLADELTRSAVERQFEVAGEALARLAKESPALAERIPDYRQVIAFRNVTISMRISTSNRQLSTRSNQSRVESLASGPTTN